MTTIIRNSVQNCYLPYTTLLGTMNFDSTHQITIQAADGQLMVPVGMVARWAIYSYDMYPPGSTMILDYPMRLINLMLNIEITFTSAFMMNQKTRIHSKWHQSDYYSDIVSWVEFTLKKLKLTPVLLIELLPVVHFCQAHQILRLIRISLAVNFDIELLKNLLDYPDEVPNLVFEILKYNIGITEPLKLSLLGAIRARHPKQLVQGLAQFLVFRHTSFLAKNYGNEVEEAIKLVKQMQWCQLNIHDRIEVGRVFEKYGTNFELELINRNDASRKVRIISKVDDAVPISMKIEPGIPEIIDLSYIIPEDPKKIVTVNIESELDVELFGSETVEFDTISEFITTVVSYWGDFNLKIVSELQPVEIDLDAYYRSDASGTFHNSLTKEYINYYDGHEIVSSHVECGVVAVTLDIDGAGYTKLVKLEDPKLTRYPPGSIPIPVTKSINSTIIRSSDADYEIVVDE